MKNSRNKGTSKKSIEKIHLQSQLTKLQETIIDKKCVLLFYNEPFIWKKNQSYVAVMTNLTTILPQN